MSTLCQPSTHVRLLWQGVGLASEASFSCRWLFSCLSRGILLCGDRWRNTCTCGIQTFDINLQTYGCLHSCSLLEGCHNIHSHLGLIFLKSGQVKKKTGEKGIEKQMREGKKMKWGERRKDKELQMKVSMNHLTRRAQRDLARREGGTVACLAPF